MDRDSHGGRPRAGASVSLTAMSGHAALQVPAKLNLFLHVTGQRTDGYHLLESVFVPINWFDQLAITVDDSGEIQRAGELQWPVDQDLAVRAAHLLRAHALGEGRLASTAGCRIHLEKSIPHGAGLGGGSADAAYTLRLLNSLWNLQYTGSVLQKIGLALGADVPFFIHGGPAYVQGIGENITPVAVASRWFLVVVPPVVVPTRAIFQDPQLQRATKVIGQAQVVQTAADSVWTLGRNDLEPVARRLYPVIAHLIEALQAVASSLGLPPSACRMSGSGSAVFLSCSDASQAHEAAEILRKTLAEPSPAPISLPAGFTMRVCETHF